MGNIRVVSALTCVLVGCTGFAKPAYGQTTSPTSGAVVDSAAAARRSLCERYVAAASGRGDPALLDDPEVQALALQAPPDLAMCGALVRDSEVLCNRLMPPRHGPSMVCLRMRSIFHELRAFPKGRSFMFDDVDWRGCRSIPFLSSRFCDPLRAALRSGDPKNCAATGYGESLCLAYANLDKSLCRAQGPLRVVAFLGKLVGADFVRSCEQAIESRAFLAQGLEELAESGAPREREFAKAELGRPDACASWAQSALELCIEDVPTTRAPGAGRPPDPASP